MPLRCSVIARRRRCSPARLTVVWTFLSQDDVVVNVVPIGDHELLGRVGLLQLFGKCLL